MRVGFAGLGRMGRRMAANCAKAGHEMTVWNRSPAPAEEVAAETGAARADTPRGLAERTEVVITMLADDAAADAVYGGPDGILAAEGGARWLVEMGTMSPATVARLAARAAEQGRTLVDAPVSGATQAAEDAQLLIMAGAGPEAEEALAPVFDAIGRRTIWLGRPGAGAAMKLAVNMLIHGLNQTLAEALTLAEGAGIDPALAYDVIEDSAAAAPMVKYRRPQYLDEAHNPVSFTLALAGKDLRLALELGAEQGTAMPQTQLTADILARAEAAGMGERDMAAVLAWMRKGKT